MRGRSCDLGPVRQFATELGTGGGATDSPAVERYLAVLDDRQVVEATCTAC